jgi:hypothetical protein
MLDFEFSIGMRCLFFMENGSDCCGAIRNFLIQRCGRFYYFTRAAVRFICGTLITVFWVESYCLKRSFTFQKKRKISESLFFSQDGFNKKRLPQRTSFS